MFFLFNETKEENIRKTKHLIYLSITIREGEGLCFVYVLLQFASQHLSRPLVSNMMVIRFQQSRYQPRLQRNDNIRNSTLTVREE